MPFTEEWLPFGDSTIRPDWWSAAEMVVLLEVSPISTEELELCQIDYRVLGKLSDQGPSPLNAQFGQVASSRKSLGGFKLLFKNNGGHCVLGDLQCCRIVWVPLPRSEILRALEQILIKDFSLLCSFHLSLDPD